MRVLCVGDIHLSDRPPGWCTDDYLTDLFVILEHTVDKARELKVDAVVWAGDVFHHKAPSRTSHATVQRSLSLIESYHCPLFIVPGNHDMCVTEVNTEALTDQGWKHVWELDGTEKFATLNRLTQELEWQTPTNINRFHYRGQGYHFRSGAVDLVTTPNHAFWGSWRAGKTLARKTAGELSKGGFRLPAVQGYRGGHADLTIKVGDYELPTDLAARLFGWFVAEGTSDRSGSRITISQSRTVNPDHFAEIEELFTQAGLRFSVRDKMLRVNDRSVAEFFIENFGYAGSKDMRIPRWVMDWPERTLKEFLYAYFRGDGTIVGSVEEREEADYDSSSVVSRTANRGLADDLSEVAVRLGYRVSVSEEREYPFGDSGYIGHAYNISFMRKRRNTILPRPEVVDVDEMVWCPTVPNETWLVRSNGLMTWTGNSYDRLDSIFATQPLGTLLRGGATMLQGWQEPKGAWASGTLESHIYGVPWLGKFTDDAVDAALKSYRVAERPGLVVAHAPIFPPGFENPFECYKAASWADRMGNQGFCYYGHVHEAHLIFEVNGVTFANMGAISRGSLSEADRDRAIKVCLWDSEEGFEAIDVPYRPADEVFKVMQARAKKDAEQSLDGFLAAVGEVSLEISGPQSVVEYVHGMELDEAVREMVTELVREAADNG